MGHAGASDGGFLPGPGRRQWWQATRRDRVAACSLGRSREQRSSASGQRGWKRHPAAGGRAGRLASRQAAGVLEPDLVEERRGDQRLGVGVRRSREELVDGSDLDDVPQIHDRDAIADVTHGAQVVRDHEQRQIEAPPEDGEQVQNLCPNGGIDRRDRLVADQEPGPQQQRPGDDDALQLAAGALVRVMPRDRGVEADIGQGLADARQALPGRSDAVLAERHRQRPLDSHPGIERAGRVLEHHLDEAAEAAQLFGLHAEEVSPVDRDGASVGLRVVEREPGQCRLPASRFADQPHDLAPLDVQGHAVDRAYPGPAPPHAAHRKCLTTSLMRTSGVGLVAPALAHRLQGVSPDAPRRTGPVGGGRVLDGPAARAAAAAAGAAARAPARRTGARRRGRRRRRSARESGNLGGAPRAGARCRGWRRARPRPAPSASIAAGRRCRGCFGHRMTALAAPSSTMRPAYMTATLSAIARTIERSWVMSRIDNRRSSRARTSRSRIWAWTVTSSAVVGSSATSRAGSPLSADAIITLCAMPPES